MSTDNNRRAYPSDLTDGQWDILRELIPPQAKKAGRPRVVDMREVINSILYLLRSGCQWDMIPHDLLPKSTVYDYFAQWRKDGTWQTMLDALRGQLRQQEAISEEPHPSAASIDSQSVKTTEVGGEVGYDGGKKITGRKRNIVVDTMGLLIAVSVTSAGLDDAAAATSALSKIPEADLSRLEVIWADNKYHNYNLYNWVCAARGSYRIEVVKRPDGSKGWVLLAKRWVVERSFAWYGRYRRHSKDYERRTDSSESMIKASAINNMLRRLSPPLNPPKPFKYKAKPVTG